MDPNNKILRTKDELNGIFYRNDNFGVLVDFNIQNTKGFY